MKPPGGQEPWGRRKHEIRSFIIQTYVRTYLRNSSSFIIHHYVRIHHHRSPSIIMHHLRTYVRTYVSLFLIIHHHASSIIIHHHSSCIIHHYSSPFIHHSSPFIIIHHSSSIIMKHHHRSSFNIMHHLRTYVRTYVSLFLIIHPHASSIIFIITHHASSITTYVRTYSSSFIMHHSSLFIIIHLRTYVRTYVSFITIPHHPSFIIMPSLFTMMHHHYSSPSIIHHLPSSSSFITIHCALCTPRLSLLCCGAPLPMVFKGKGDLKSVEGTYVSLNQTGVWGLGSGGRQPYPTANVPDVFRKPHPEESTTPPTTFSEPGVAGDLLGSQEQPWFGSGVSRATVVGSGVSRTTVAGEFLGSQEPPWSDRQWSIGGGGGLCSEGALRILRGGGPAGSR